MNVRLHVWGLTQDRRTKSARSHYATLEQQMADIRAELNWKRRVMLNILRRRFGAIL